MAVELFREKKNCSACGACVNICHKSAISMREDEYGFLYPQIDKGKCIECGLCNRVCSWAKPCGDNKPQATFVAQSKNEDIKKSASGGVFANLARAVLADDGIVYGAALEYEQSKLVPKHIAVTSLEDLVKLQGSKYVQSSVGFVFKDVKTQLQAGKTVLFSGTPCQIDGLRQYLQKDYENLFCIDIICHGVPNTKFFQGYISTLEKKYADKIIDFKFRDKTIGWSLTANAYTANAYTANAGNKVFPCYMSSYYDLFLKSYIYRENCYSCKYANEHRVGDITIGDYWGVEEEHPELLVSKEYVFKAALGVSVIIVNNDRGQELLQKYGKAMWLHESVYEKAAKHNRQLNQPSALDKDKRGKLLEVYKDGGYEAVDKYYWKSLGWKRRLINRGKLLLPTEVKVVLKKLMGR